MSPLFKTNVIRGVKSEGHLTNDQELTANPTGTWMCSMEKRGYTPKESGIFKAVDEIEDQSQKVGSIKSLKAELLLVIKTEVHSEVIAAKKEVLLTTVEETLRNMFLCGYEKIKNEVQESSYEFINTC